MIIRTDHAGAGSSDLHEGSQGATVLQCSPCVEKRKEVGACEKSEMSFSLNVWSESRCNISELDHAVTVVAFPVYFL